MEAMIEKTTEAVELTPLSDKHQRVLDEYLKVWNQSKAYMSVYTDVTIESARASATRLFSDVNFRGHLQLRLSELHMSAEEAFKLTTDIAKADMTEVLEPLGDDVVRQIREKGFGRLLKKVRRKTTRTKEGAEETVYEFEMYNAQEAQRDILKMRGKFPGSQRENAAGTPGVVAMPPAALIELVELIEQHNRQAVDKARAVDGILHEEKQDE